MGLNDFYQIFKLYLCAENVENKLKFQKFIEIQSALFAARICTVA